MAAATETAIWMGWRHAIAAAAGTLPVAWPGETFTPPTSGATLLPYMSVGKATAPPERALIGRGDHWQGGSVTLVYVAPVGRPLEWYLQKAAVIADAFHEDRRIRFEGICLRITSRPHLADPYPDGGYLRTPIIINWQASA